MNENDGARSVKTRRGGAALAFCLALALGGCLAGPNFKPPVPPDVAEYLPPESPAQRPESGADAAQHIALGQRIPAQWWELFHSSRLDETLRQVIADSYTLAAAKATLAQAQEAIVEARAALYPQIDLGASARRSSAPTGLGMGGNLFSLGPSVSYSIDAFGGTRRHIEQAAALAENQRYQLAAAYLTLTGSSVTQAITIASTNFQIATVQDLIKNDQKNLDLVQRSFGAGKVARSDVLTAEAQLASDRTQLAPLRQQLSVARHALAVLAGRAPGQWAPPDFDIDGFTLPDDVPVSLPSELVHQRPDILASEALLHADSAAIGVATAQLYPSITLSASLGQAAQTLASLVRSASRAWDAGAGVDAPLYHGGALRAQQRAAVDAYNAQLATYRQTILLAFGQVADALSALEHDAELVSASSRSVEVASTSLTVQRSSYAAGKTSALQLIVAENTYSSARLGYVRAIGQRLSDTAQLFIALGGGWWNDGDQAPCPPATSGCAPSP
jgi:NodT family efflux transporter outer membrane factor (OMF) lipoprotein